MSRVRSNGRCASSVHNRLAVPSRSGSGRPPKSTSGISRDAAGWITCAGFAFHSREAGAQGFMPAKHLVQAPLQHSRVECARQSKRQGNVVSGVCSARTGPKTTAVAAQTTMAGSRPRGASAVTAPAPAPPRSSRIPGSEPSAPAIAAAIPASAPRSRPGSAADPPASRDGSLPCGAMRKLLQRRAGHRGHRIPSSSDELN